uniref:Uncharacterized protein n=1 Tax=Oryza meridionalis TaxID=40149 RepID=A0A0E0EBC9_9ORYZ
MPAMPSILLRFYSLQISDIQIRYVRFPRYYQIFNIFDGAECNIPNHELLVDRCLIGVILLLPQTGNEIHEIDICMTSGMVIFFVECSFKNLHLFV